MSGLKQSVEAFDAAYRLARDCAAGLPAARLGDLTAHGGGLTTVSSDVIIGGKPSARAQDMHLCSLVDPGPLPHVGGPALPPSSSSVFITFRSAARGDACSCSGAADTIMTGEDTVLIGRRL
jgi:uncharacterized Zn-binding protein involved in type VI secretion